MENTAWRYWLVLGFLLSVGSFAAPDSMWWFAAFTAGIGVLSAAVAVTGVVRLRRPAAPAWLFVAAAVGVNGCGSVVEAFYDQVLHAEVWPTPAMWFYLLLYPFLTVGLWLLIRRRSRRHQWTHAIDALIITAGVGLLAWVVPIQAAFGDPSASLLARVANLSSPCLDLVVIGTLTRMLLRGGWNAPALRLLTAATGLFLLTDVAWAVVNQMGWEPAGLAGGVLTLLPLLGYVVAAAAPLHPSAVELADPDLREHEMGPALLAMLSLACLVAPVVLLVQAARGEVTNGVAIGLCAAGLMLLVIARMADLVRRVQLQSAQLGELAREDPLTGLPNRRALESGLSAEMERARRDPHSLAVVMIDLDHFKRFNDTYGHPAGDELLRTASAEWRGLLRSGDLLARLGGEEFVLVLPALDADAAEALVARLQAATPLAQSFSAGVALWDGQELSGELIERADAAMYRAKSGGRARTVVAVGDRPRWPLRGSGVTLQSVPVQEAPRSAAR